MPPAFLHFLAVLSCQYGSRFESRKRPAAFYTWAIDGWGDAFLLCVIALCPRVLQVRGTSR